MFRSILSCTTSDLRAASSISLERTSDAESGGQGQPTREWDLDMRDITCTILFDMTEISLEPVRVRVGTAIIVDPAMFIRRTPLRPQL